MHALNPATESTPVDITTLKRHITTALQAPDITHGLARTFRATLKEIDLYRNYHVSRSAITAEMIGTHTHVQIGGGGHTIPDFYNIDIVSPADLVWDVRESIPLPDSTVEFLFSEHFLEHIDYPHSVKNYIAELHRITTPGGQVVTGVPNAELVLNAYHRRDPDFFRDMRQRWYSRRNCLADLNTYSDLINFVFRDQDDDDNYTPHLWAYDHDKLADLFAEAGFSSTQPWTFDPAIANPKREWGSIYIIATK